ncbi:hypothetical protein JOC37_001438 [Desulfohalotomaculum tongense]|nr:hypothetical protein [Desulforadius tongensis]
MFLDCLKDDNSAGVNAAEHEIGFNDGDISV